MFGTGKSPVSLNYFKAVFLSYRILAQVIQSVKKKDGDLVEQNLCAVLSRDMRAGSWHIRAAWLGLTYGECGPRRCLFFNLWRPQSNLCDPTVVLFRGNTSHVVKSSSAPLLRLNERLSPEVLFESLPFPPIFLMTEDSCRVAAVSNLCAFDWWLTLFLYW